MVSARAAEIGTDVRRTNSDRADLPIPMVRHNMRSSLKRSAIPYLTEAFARKSTVPRGSRLWQASRVGQFTLNWLAVTIGPPAMGRRRATHEGNFGDGERDED